MSAELMTRPSPDPIDVPRYAEGIQRFKSSPATTRLGAQVIDGGAATRFRVFTDRAQSCQIRIVEGDGQAPGTTYPLAPIGGGCHETRVPGVGHGTLYEVLLDGRTLPDPYARFLPRGVSGPAMVVQTRYEWRHGPGVSPSVPGQVIYEIHIGTFTPEGTYAAAALRLPDLVDLGVTTIELMPVSAFPGRRGWGYDGVAHFAPFAGYGSPDDLRRFIDEAHGLGLSVLLDVVYNHFGPAGNYLGAYSSTYFTSDFKTDWGDSPDFRGPAMRDYVLDNAAYWLRDFRFDGLRLDATHAIIDPSERHILKEVAELAHALEPRKVTIAEDNRNEPALVIGCGLDAIWADDFHHVAHVTMTGELDGYYCSYSAGAELLAETIRKGWLYEGQIDKLTGKPRGKPALELPASAFVYHLQNHDQIGNRALGDRVHGPAQLERYCALSTVLLFLPMTPLLFMGQEWAASSPFCYFTDHDSELGKLISEGRRNEFAAFATFASPGAGGTIPDPQADDTFLRSKLRWEERGERHHVRVHRLYRELLRLRRTDEVLRTARRDELEVDADGSLLIARRTHAGQDRLLLANLSDLPVAAERVAPLLVGRALQLRSDGSRAVDGPLPPWVALVTAGPATGAVGYPR